MSLGEKLLALRKKAGLSQEEVAEKLDVSRQTVSKWETGQTVPELIKAKLLSQLYHVSYDYLISENGRDMDITDMAALSDEIDWTSAWSKKYPILASYQKVKGMDAYREKIDALHDDMKLEFDLSELDTFLVLKDMLYQKYRAVKKGV